MTIKLITGLDGTGKTLAMVDMACTMQEEAQKARAAGKTEPERKLYYWGIDGLKPGVAEPIEHPSKWIDLPPGSILLIDECSKVFGTEEISPRKMPEWIKELREHRHHAVDIVMACQDPTQLHLYVRKLIKWHVHHVRKFGSRNIQRFEWSSCVSTPTSTATIKRGKQTLWRLPKHRYDMYVSAKEHHEKLRLPLRLLVFPLALIVVPVLGWYGWKSVQSLIASHAQSGPVSTITGVSGSVSPAMPETGPGTQARAVTAAEWTAVRTPRVPGIPWSAPMWDGLTAEGVPDLYCVEMEQEDLSKRCTCYTEQVTKVNDIPTAVCSKIANDGIYNPYRRSSQPGMERRGGREGEKRPETPPARDTASRVTEGHFSRPSTIPQSYTPPELSQVGAIGMN